MVQFSRTDKSGFNLGRGIRKTFLQETPIGPLNKLSATSFRPTEAEKLILLNIDDMIAQGRKVTQQDAINVSEEELDEQELDKDQLEAAYKQLIDIQLITVEPDQTITITPQGEPVVEELKKAKEQEDQEKPPEGQDQMGGGMDMMGGQMPGAENMGAPTDGGPQLPMEGSLLRYINDMSKLLQG